MGSLKLENLNKAFGAVHVLHDIDLQIENGEFVVFVGPSGCGKSTLLRIIAGLEDDTSGTIAIGNRDVSALSPAERKIAMVFQSYALYPHMSVRKNLAFGLENLRFKRAEIESRINEAARMLAIEPYLDRKPKQLSGGQRQRVAIGRAIVRDPKVFLFDEPLSNLDAALRVATRLEIAKLHRSMHDTTMIYVTHDQVEAMTLADRICVLRDGRVEQIGTPLELYESPVNTFVAGFIGSPKMNFLTGKYAEAEGAKTIGIRPEHITIGTDGSGWSGEIVHSEMLGSDSYIYVEIGAGEPVVVREEGVTGRTAGERIAIAPDAAQIHRFDADGRALACNPARGAA